MATSNLRVTGRIGGVVGYKDVAIDIASAASAGAVTQVVLASGANTITVPTAVATSGCIIQLPATNTSVTTLKGVSGDTGIALGKTTTTVLNWDSTAAPTSFVLTSVSAQTGLTTEITYF